MRLWIRPDRWPETESADEILKELNQKETESQKALPDA
jgi:hypothetical protein